MNSEIKQTLIEIFEVIGKSADDCTYILWDKDISEDVRELKLKTRVERIQREIGVVSEIMANLYAPIMSSED